ncbi:MAG: chromophore lyase CpcT/CpeT [Planctomycetes bacterium]|nr:chromophore lyase CpcT/CpeT [Planctomycetota bacterium]
MVRSHHAVWLSFACSWLASCASPGDPAPVGPTPVEELAKWMEGSFDSAAQAARDPHYLDVHLSMTRIFPERDDGPWLYVEQAVASALDRPYRQRVYRLVALEAGRVESQVYTLPGDPLAYAGGGRDPAKLATLDPESLVAREGCAIELERIDASTWRGSTRGRGCASNLSNASYATSEVVVTSTLLTSWDRGFDAAGKQVWGAVDGPYEFVKVVLDPAPTEPESIREETSDSETSDSPDG